MAGAVTTASRRCWTSPLAREAPMLNVGRREFIPHIEVLEAFEFGDRIADESPFAAMQGEVIEN
jgi:hypothetical protein